MGDFTLNVRQKPMDFNKWQLGLVMNLYVVCSANIWRSLGASGAMRTRPEYAQRAAVWRARDPRRGAESRRHSAGCQPARGLEGCQTARRGALRHFFLG